MAGDAAGFVDPFVGDGISLALRSGRLAGECLIPFFAGTISLRGSSAQLSHDVRAAAHARVPDIFENPADAEFAAGSSDSDSPLAGEDSGDHAIFSE